MTDSEERKTYESGAERSKLDDVRFDLISPQALRRIAATYAEGAKKYSDHNWRKGFPVSSLLNHVLTHLNNYVEGTGEEDELAHAAWGVMALMEQEVTHPELDDRWKFGVNSGPQDQTADGRNSEYMAEPGRLFLVKLIDSNGDVVRTIQVPAFHSIRVDEVSGV